MTSNDKIIQGFTSENPIVVSIINLPFLKENEVCINTKYNEDFQGDVKELKERIESNDKIVVMLQRVIARTRDTIDSMINGHIQPMPVQMKDPDIWANIQEQRLEYLQGFYSSLVFIRDHPDKEMQI